MIYFLTVNYYSTNLIEKLLASLPLHQEIVYQFIIVNNSHDDSSIYRLKTEFIVILEAGENLGFGKACNLGFNWIYRQNRQALIWLINPDAYLPENFLKQASDFFINHPEVSILGTTVYEPDGKVWFAGGQFNPNNGTITEIQSLSSELEKVPYLLMDWVTGCSLLVNPKKFPNCPYFDEDYFLYYEDFDFCRRYAKEGHIIGLTAQIFVIHQPSSITSRNLDLKRQHSIYSYLLSLEKYTRKLVLFYRLFRIGVSSLILLPFRFRMCIDKFIGVFMYVRRCSRMLNFNHR